MNIYHTLGKLGLKLMKFLCLQLQCHQGMASSRSGRQGAQCGKAHVGSRGGRRSHTDTDQPNLGGQDPSVSPV